MLSMYVQFAHSINYKLCDPVNMEVAFCQARAINSLDYRINFHIMLPE